MSLITRTTRRTIPNLVKVASRAYSVELGAKSNEVNQPRQRSTSRQRPRSDDYVPVNVQIQQAIAKGIKPPHLKTLADLSPEEINRLVIDSLAFKLSYKHAGSSSIRNVINKETIAIIFNKRSTRTRVASETAVSLLGGHPMFLGGQDIQLGVNEILEDSMKVIGSMTRGIMARVGSHDDIEEMTKHSPVPVINALSDLYHPTQILADLLTLLEHYAPLEIAIELDSTITPGLATKQLSAKVDLATVLKGKKAAWVGDTNNISNELLVTLPRFGMKFAIASPSGYDKVDSRVWAEVEKAGTKDLVQLTNSPADALKDADVVITDTWISMGQEEEKVARLEAFKGYQITDELVDGAGAKPDWVFLHCLPRKQEEVDDKVFYGPRSKVFPEAENRKWTILSVFHSYFGAWNRKL